MILRPYENGDIARIPHLREASDSAISGWAWTIEKDGAVLAVFSLVEFWEGVGHVTGFVSDDTRKCGLAFTKASKKLFQLSVGANPQFHRIQTFVFNDENARWAKAIGLSFESVMAQGAPDRKDVSIFAYVR